MIGGDVVLSAAGVGIVRQRWLIASRRLLRRKSQKEGFGFLPVGGWVAGAQVKKVECRRRRWWPHTEKYPKLFDIFFFFFFFEKNTRITIHQVAEIVANRTSNKLHLFQCVVIFEWKKNNKKISPNLFSWLPVEEKGSIDRTIFNWFFLLSINDFVFQSKRIFSWPKNLPDWLNWHSLRFTNCLMNHERKKKTGQQNQSLQVVRTTNRDRVNFLIYGDIFPVCVCVSNVARVFPLENWSMKDFFLWLNSIKKEKPCDPETFW